LRQSSSGQLPALERLPLAPAKAAQLLLVGEAKPELDQHDSLDAQTTLERDDLVVGALPLRF